MFVCCCIYGIAIKTLNERGTYVKTGKDLWYPCGILKDKCTYRYSYTPKCISKYNRVEMFGEITFIGTIGT